MFEPILHELPIVDVLPMLEQALDASGLVVLEAPPGAGKSTLVPLALLDAPWLGGQRILMLEPRRIAARAGAERMAELMGEKVGETVGYRMRMDSRIGPCTRIEVVTEGVLTRMMQDDPALEGVGLVIFDEFHERSLHADLGLALALQVRAMLRDDLRILIMSATLDGMPLVERLQARKVRSAGRMHPVEVRYSPPGRDLAIEAHCAAVTRRMLAEEEGDVLVFLPGKREIQRVMDAITAFTSQSEEGGSIDILPLYGEMNLAEQHAVLAPRRDRRRVILATNIAETSLTIEGVRIVIDSGLMRLSRLDPVSGMARLVTQRISRANAEQRRGRAGRLGPGLCIRLWSESEHNALTAQTEPEILRADLVPLALELAQWGAVPDELFWLDAPPPAPYAQAREVLQGLGVLDEQGRITEHGRVLAHLPVHPRLAHMLIEGERLGHGRLACEIAALLSERDLLRADLGRPGADLVQRIEALRHGTRGLPAGLRVDEGLRTRIRQTARDLMRRLRLKADDEGFDEQDAGALLALAYPDRIAKARSGQPGRFLLRGGQGALIDPADPLAHEPWLVIAQLDGDRREARIFLAAAVSQERLETLFASQIQTQDMIDWDAREAAVRSVRQISLGALVLDECPLTRPDPSLLRTAMLEGIRQLGLGSLPWQPWHQQWRGRVALLRRVLGMDWPDVSDQALLAGLDDWLGPWLDGISRQSQLARLDLDAALRALLDWPMQQALDQLAPTHLEVPSGSRIALDYSPCLEGDAPPMLAVKLQELFGLQVTPRIAQGRVAVMIHMLSPARRPVAVTQDLASFWRGPYQDVRKDMRGRYPKHPWPDDPLTAPATRRSKSASP